ncbi:MULTISPECIES: hypothetical protein [unclassified Streptomyces]|uniref:hypothetical protein n=1 Tax=unclassified Streptomyces TaxID=2593676 RepID=UPI003824488E
MAGDAAPRHLQFPAAEAQQQRFGAGAVVVIREDAEVLARMTACREEFPDGTYGGARRLRLDPEAALHVKELTAGLEGWRVGARPELAVRAQQLDTDTSNHCQKEEA